MYIKYSLFLPPNVKSTILRQLAFAAFHGHYSNIYTQTVSVAKGSPFIPNLFNF